MISGVHRRFRGAVVGLQGQGDINLRLAPRSARPNMARPYLFPSFEWMLTSSRLGVPFHQSVVIMLRTPCQRQCRYIWMHVAWVPYLQRSRNSTSYFSYLPIPLNIRRRFLDHVHFILHDIPASWISVADISAGLGTLKYLEIPSIPLVPTSPIVSSTTCLLYTPSLFVACCVCCVALGTQFCFPSIFCSPPLRPTHEPLLIIANLGLG